MTTTQMYFEARRLEASASASDRAKASRLWAEIEAADAAQRASTPAPVRTSLYDLPIAAWAWRADGAEVRS